MTELTKYDAACRAVAEAKSVDEAKEILNAAAAMKAYARQANNKQMEADAFEIRLRAERRVGEMMRAQRETVGTALPSGNNQYAKVDRGFRNPDPLPTLDDAGIDKNLAKRARKLERTSDDEFEKIVSKGREEIDRVVDKALIKVRGTQGSGDNEWYTPTEYVERARTVLGAIDLDPASSVLAQEIIRAQEFFSIDNDGLNQEWWGRVWLNPPYAQPWIERFIDKLVSEYNSENIDAAVLLTHNYTDTAWFQTVAANATALCFTRGRIRFYNGDELASPTQGQVFSYFGADIESFSRVFSDVGFIAIPRTKPLEIGF